MKYLKKFKLLESWKDDDALFDQLDDDDIEEAFDRNYNTDSDEIISNFPDLIWDHIDDERYVRDFISDEIDSREMNEFSENEFKDYIKNHLTDAKEEKIIEYYKENTSYDDAEEPEYEDSMLDELSEDELIDVIEDDGDSEDFIEERVKSWYVNSSAKDIFNDIYGYDDFNDMYQKSSKSYSYSNEVEKDVKNIVKSLLPYVDTDELEKEYKDGEDFDYKKDQVKDYISHDKDLQRKLLELKSSNVMLLHKLFKEGGNNIGDEYVFQKTYINRYVKKHKNNPNNIAEALKNLDDNYKLDSKIKAEYEEDMWMVNSKKFNL